MTFGLVNVSFSLPKWQAVKMTFFAPCIMQFHLKEMITLPLYSVEACVAKWLTPRTPDLEVQSSSLARRVVSLDRELYSTLSLFTQVYKWVPATYCWGVTLRWTSIRPGWSSNTPWLASCCGNWDKLRPFGPLAHEGLYLTLPLYSDNNYTNICKEALRK